MSALASIGYNLRNLFNFHRRDVAHVFWPYVLTVIAVLVATPMFFLQALVANIASDFASGAEAAATPVSLIPWFFGWLGLATLLLGAAVSRRLRDANQSTLWGVWPLLSAILNGYAIYESFSADDVPNPWFFLSFAANFVCLVMLIVLIVKLNKGTATPPAST